MSMKVFSFGEALIDLLSNHCTGAPQDTPESFTKYAGGAPANVAVAVARLGGESYLIGKVGSDAFGRFLIESLQGYGVSTEFTSYSQRGKTALAFVSLDAQGERSFSFYDDVAAHNDFAQADFSPALFAEPGIFHFCSGMLAKTGIRESTLYGLERFRNSHSIISFDINLRPAFWDQPHRAAETILAAAAQADIIKASREELVELYGAAGIDGTVESLLAQGVSLLIITDGANPIAYHTGTLADTRICPEQPVVDTTAAGDAFVGALLAQVAAKNHAVEAFKAWVSDAGEVQSTIDFAAKCGAFAVSRFGAFASLPRREDVDGTAPTT